MVTLAGYDIFGQIYAGSRILVYRGERQCDRQPVILKFLNQEYPSFSELLQFCNQVKPGIYEYSDKRDRRDR
jgi:hypothetical protein